MLLIARPALLRSRRRPSRGGRRGAPSRVGGVGEPCGRYREIFIEGVRVEEPGEGGCLAETGPGSPKCQHSRASSARFANVIPVTPARDRCEIHCTRRHFTRTEVNNPLSAAMLPVVADPARLAAANSRLAVARTSGQVAGPLLGGLLVAAAGSAAVFAANAASFCSISGAHSDPPWALSSCHGSRRRPVARLRVERRAPRA
jgi:hypothetical protein